MEATARRKAGVPAWRARYMAVWENLTPFPNVSSIGVYHSSDIPIFFGIFTDAAIGNGPIADAERKLSSRYMDAWLTFAEVGFFSILMIRNLT